MKKRKNSSQNFYQGAALLFLSTVLVKLIGAFFKIPLSGDKFLGDVGFGYFSSSYDLYTPIYTLASTGLPIAVSKVVAECVAQKRYSDVKNVFAESKKMFFGFGIIGALLILLLIFPICAFTDPTRKTLYSLLMLVPSFVLCCAISVYRGYYEGLQNMKPTAISNVIEALGKLVLGLSFAYITLKLTGNAAYSAAAAMAGIATGTLAALIFMSIYYRNTENKLLTCGENKSMGFNKREIFKLLASIAVPVVLASLSSSIVSLIDALTVNPILAKLVDSGTGELKEIYSDLLQTSAFQLSVAEIPAFLYGIKGKAYTVYNLVPTFTSVLAISALPALTKCWVKGVKNEIKSCADSILKITCIVAFPAGIGLFAVGKSVMSFLYSGAASAEIGGVMLSIYGVAAVFSGICIPLTSMLQAVDCQVRALRNIAIGAFVKILFNIFLVSIPEINIYGCAVSTAVCYFIIFILNLITFINKVKFCPDLANVFLKPLISALCCGAAAYFTVLHFGNGKTVFALSLIFAVIVYFLLLLTLRGITKQDLYMLKSKNSSE